MPHYHASVSGTPASCRCRLLADLDSSLSSVAGLLASASSKIVNVAQLSLQDDWGLLPTSYCLVAVRWSSRPVNSYDVRYPFVQASDSHFVGDP